jgi:hypothetical protein
MNITDLGEEQREARQRIVEQNGNEGTHYDQDADDTFEIKWVTSDTTSYINQGSEFDSVVSKTLIDIRELLITKGIEYRRNGNVYHNFEQGAAMTGTSREKVLDGFLLKHEISINDMTNDLESGILPTREKVEEKFNDNLIYLLIKKAMILDRID